MTKPVCNDEFKVNLDRIAKQRENEDGSINPFDPGFQLRGCWPAADIMKVAVDFANPTRSLKFQRSCFGNKPGCDRELLRQMFSNVDMPYVTTGTLQIRIINKILT